MASVTNLPSHCTASGIEVSLDRDHFSLLSSSEEHLDDITMLRTRMQTDGYLYLPGLIPRQTVLRTRSSIGTTLSTEGLIDSASPEKLQVARPVDTMVRRRIAQSDPALHALVRCNELITFFNRFLGGEARVLDFIGLRVVAKEINTYPHADRVYFTRGTEKLFTTWIPLGDVPIEHGGLAILEGSHNNVALRNSYSRRDVDDYCINRPNSDLYRTNKLQWTGALSKDFNRLRRKLGGRWLSANYIAGDVVIFDAFTIHGSLDNHWDAFRLSTDARYQLKNDSVDHRYIGPEPSGNGLSAKRGIVC